MYRIRARFCKMDLMKFISHLDLMRMMERTLRRSNVPLGFSQGFNPHPKISFATALAIGVSSEGEYIDIDVTEHLDLESFKSNMNKQLPSGIHILQCKYISLSTKPLMAVVDFSSYIIKCYLEREIDEDIIKRSIDDFLNQQHIFISKTTIKRKNEIKKEIDIKPLIRSMEISDISDMELILKVNVATGSKGNLKPEIVVNELIDSMNLPINRDNIRIHRLDLFVFDNGHLATPMDIAT